MGIERVGGPGAEVPALEGVGDDDDDDDDGDDDAWIAYWH
jgi:hypothetical protein